MSSPDFYSNARAYDIAFGDRDFAAECDFLGWCLREHGRLEDGDPWLGIGRAIRPVSPPLDTISDDSTCSFLELACGPARHAREFARRGWRAIGLDLSADMLTYAAEGAAREKVAIETMCADMCDFTLGRPVALVANMMESITHLVTNAQVVKHLRTVAQNMLAGGIYVIELAHPSTLGRESLPNSWSCSDGGTDIDIVFGMRDDPYDWVTQQWIVTTRLTIREAGRLIRTVEERNSHRWYLVQELMALIDLSCAFERVWWYGNMAVPPLQLDNSDAAERMIVVLRK